ncbi:flagellar hook-length control protein FliK [Magnetococcus sp. PR-3]|uniref:flagellar hook-length control protein FliK n=1 Tax=Magnetococcus sp. PR-3 TaxID=3120355 RepID=UPI002FCDEC9C
MVAPVQSFVTITGPASGSTGSAQLSLAVGDTLSGRIQTMNQNGQGTIRLSNGSTMNFQGNPNVQAGERVAMQVIKLEPQPTFKMVNSESAQAGKLAFEGQQSLARGPELFAKLLEGAGLLKGGKAAFLVGGSKGGLTLANGQTLAQTLQSNLTNVSLQSLVKGDPATLARLLEGGSKQELTEAIRNLRQAADGIRGADVRMDGEAASVRNALGRVGDMLAMQDLLPRTPQMDPNSAILGYRIFWLDEGGLGEAIIRREKAKQGGEEEDTTSVLLSLNMTELGMVQANIQSREGYVGVNLRAEDEAALAALRREVRTLRQSMNEAGLPLQALELAKLSAAQISAERAHALGLDQSGNTGFQAEG